MRVDEVDQTIAMEARSREVMERDELYQQSLAYLQRGQWEQAMEAIQRLQQRYGEASEVEALLQEARFKATLDRETPALERLSWHEQWVRWRPLVLSFLLGVLVLAALAAGVLMYQQRILPARLARQEEIRLAQLRQEGQFYLAARQYDQAIQAFQDLLAEVPDDQVARQGIAAAEERRQLEALHQRATELLEMGEWKTALHVMDQIQARKPDYGGLAEERALAEKQLQLKAAFEAAEATYRMGDWEQAQLQYEGLRALDQSFERAVVTEHLFQAYLQRGRELVATAGESVAPVKEACELFAKALVLRPGEPQAVAERHWAETYIEGRQAYEGEEWERAAEALGQLYADQPDYLEGRVALLLYQAYLRKGQAYEAQADLSEALGQYQRALEVRGVDHSEAEARIVALGPTPTPTPAPVETPTPTPTVQPLPGWPFDLTFMGARPDCAGTGVRGVIRDQNGLPLQGVEVRLWNSAGESWTSSPSDVDGQYQIVVANEPLEDTWTACVVEEGQPVSPSYSFLTSSGCVNGLQEYRIDWRRSE